MSNKCKNPITGGHVVDDDAFELNPRKNNKNTDKNTEDQLQNADELVSKIFGTPSECAFTKEQGAVCSPKHIVKEMSSFLAKDNINHDKTPHKIVNTMKERLNCKSESCILKSKEFREFATVSGIDDLLNEFF